MFASTCQRYTAALALVFALAACQSTPQPEPRASPSPSTSPTPLEAPVPQPVVERHGDPPGTAHPAIWPMLRSPLAPDPELEDAVSAILEKMTLEEKVGQVLQPSITAITPEEAKTYHIGSVLNGGGGWPGDVRKAK